MTWMKKTTWADYCAFLSLDETPGANEGPEVAIHRVAACILLTGSDNVIANHLWYSTLRALQSVQDQNLIVSKRLAR